MDMADLLNDDGEDKGALGVEKDLVDAKLLWQCHRGMLELDLILQGFLKAHYASLAPDLQKNFQLLLKQPDPILLTWLLGHDIPEDKEMKAIVALIRSFDYR
jgi:antitoxin CptB